MKKIRLRFAQFLKNPAYLILSAILIFGCFIRIIYLGSVPPGLANDEANIVLNAQSFLKTGENIPGIITGILGNPTGDLTAGVHSEISSYILIPWYLIFGFNFVTIKLPFVFAGLGIIILSFLIVRKMVSQGAGLITAGLSAINPWSIFFSRSAYESILSAFFYLLAIFIVISQKNWRLLWALPFFILGLLCYFAAKTIMLPLALVCLFCVLIFKMKDSIKPLIVLNVILLGFLIIYLPILNSSKAGARFNELQNKQSLSEVVNIKRTSSLDLPLSQLFENRIIEDLRVRIGASLGEFSANLLFLDGNPESIPSLNIPDHAPLYLLDLPFIVLGIIFLARTNLFFLTLTLGVLLTTLIPNFLNLQGTTYMIRTVMLFPFLILISGSGLYYLKTLLMKNLFLKIIFSLTIAAYIFSFGNFIYQYFGRLPIEKSEGWFLTDRILSKYISASLKNYPDTNITVISPSPKHTFYRYLFFNNLYQNSEEINKINQSLRKFGYSYKGVNITDKCLLPGENNSIVIIDKSMDCPGSSNIFISSVRDAGDKYQILDDKLCSGLITRSYPLLKNISDLDIEKLSKEDFCSKYIIRH